MSVRDAEENKSSISERGAVLLGGEEKSHESVREKFPKGGIQKSQDRQVGRL